MFDSLNPIFVIARQEIRDQFRDWRIIVPILILTLIFPAIMNFTAQQAVNFVQQYGASLVAERLIPFLLMIVGFFPISISMVIALESFVGEKERRSIEPLLTSPLIDWHLYLGKLIAVLMPPLISAFLGIGVYLWGVYRQIGWVAEPQLLIQILLLTTVQALVMVSGAVVISTQATSVRAANLLASFIIIPVSFLIQAESFVMFWGEYGALWWIIFALLIVAGLLVRTGISHFNREELLGREMDVLQIRQGLLTFWGGFRGGAGSPGAWYRYVGSLLRQMALPAVLMGGMLVLAMWIGFGQSKIFSLPEGAINLTSLEISVTDQANPFSLLAPGSVVLVLFQNVRVMAIATMLGIFSFGVLGILVMMLPMILIGSFMGIFQVIGITSFTLFTGLVLPHGILEIPAIILTGAAILVMGGKIAAPSEGKSIGEVFLNLLGSGWQCSWGLFCRFWLVVRCWRCF